MVTLVNLTELWEPDENARIPESTRTSRGPDFKMVPELEGYAPPTRFTSILGQRLVGLDIETHDPDIEDKGPGARRPEGKIVGIGIGPRSNVIYYPIGHQNGARNISFREAFLSQLREEAKAFDGELVGANLAYDLDWLEARHQITFPRAKIRDVQIAEPLLDENKLTYKLNMLAKEYQVPEKLGGDLATSYGKAYIQNMHKVDPGHASLYCVRDIETSIDIYLKQVPLLKEQELWELFEIESDLNPLLLRMRAKGVRVDIPRVEIALGELEKEKQRVTQEIEDLAKMPVDVWSSDSIAAAFRALELGFPMTQGKNPKPSFTKDWLANHHSPIAKLINEKRGYDKIGGTFLQSYMLDSHVNGRIHCQFNQLKSDAGGTVSGRFSSSYPNLQNIPTRHKILGPLCRSLFIPEEDHDWGCTDWSQIEFRFLVHYAVSTFFNPEKHDPIAISSARAAADAYINDPSTDFHKEAAAITGLDRKFAKNVNFGVVYGMGVPTMAANLGKSVSEAEPILNAFHTKMPFLKAIYEKTGAAAEHRGYIKTILGRRRRFDVLEALAFPKAGGRPIKFYGKEEACQRWLEEQSALGYNPGRNMRRAYTHKALNALLQGSAADLMKKCMVDIWNAGIFEIIIPHLTVHDELDVSVPRTAEGAEAFKELTNMMSTSMKLKVPVFASASTGINWSEAKGND